MKEVLLTNHERKKLENELRKYKSHRNKEIKFFLKTSLIGIALGCIMNYWIFENGKFLYVLLIIAFLMLLSVVGGFLFSYTGISKLKSDLKKGKKLVGKSEIERINRFNRKISLHNGINVYEPIEYLGTFKIGDVVNFKISPSNEYIFECNIE